MVAPSVFRGCREPLQLAINPEETGDVINFARPRLCKPFRASLVRVAARECFRPSPRRTSRPLISMSTKFGRQQTGLVIYCRLAKRADAIRCSIKLII